MTGSAVQALDFPPAIDEAPQVPVEPVLIGRESELNRLREMLQGALQGQGRLALLGGEAGIGKSRLAEELAREAHEQGCAVVWGRCWEAGGAPAFWPWRQALTGLSHALDAEPWARNQVLSAFMRGQSEASASFAELSGLEPEHARFLLMEAVNSTLSEAARSQPLVLILEDMHTADAASLSLLEFLEPHLRQCRILMLATYRPLELPRHAEPLRRTCQRGENILLGPLSTEAINAYILHHTRSPLAADTLQEVAKATEGNPLFLAEVSRVLAREPSAPRQAMLTQGIHHIIQQRLAVHAAADVALLEVAAVIGRDFRLADVLALTDLAEPALEQALERMVSGAALQRTGLQAFRFSHILIREALYYQLAADRRRQLHRTRAKQLQARCESGDTNWTEVAHHFLAAEAIGDATIALEKAAKLALSQLAFDDAVALMERAMSSLPEDVAPTRRAELLLLLAHARLNAGAITSGRAACYEVARIAEQLDNADLLARAALECGSIYVFGKVDKRLVGLLDDALRALPQAQVALRAEVCARLAAALQPSPDPDYPISLAYQAIDLARSQSDEQVLLRVLLSAISALMDMTPALERLGLNQEYAALADKLGATSHLWRARCRLLFDHFELGQLDEAYENLAQVVALAERLDHPDYLWRATAMRAMAATFRGRFQEASARLEETDRLAGKARDPNWQRAKCMMRLSWHRAQGQRMPEQLIDQLSEHYEGEVFGYMSIWSEWARHGQVDQLRGALDPEVIAIVLSSGDAQLLQELAFIAIALRDPELSQRAYEAMSPHVERFVSGGMTGLTWEPPLSRAMGLLCLETGRAQEGLAHLHAALDAACQSGSRGYEVWIRLDLAKAEISGGNLRRALELLDQASEQATALGLSLALDQVDALRVQAGEESAPPSSRALPTMLARNAISLDSEGELWCLRAGGEEVRLANTKGVRLLAQLMAQPGQEFHVLDLEKPAANETKFDAGSAGETLDEQARQQYRTRIEELRSEIEQAEDFNDLARAEALNAEFEALTKELSRAFGLSGRSRPVASAVERARINVQRRLKDAIKRIRACSPELAKQIERSVRTGTYCVYEP